MFRDGTAPTDRVETLLGVCPRQGESFFLFYFTQIVKSFWSRDIRFTWQLHPWALLGG